MRVPLPPSISLIDFHALHGFADKWEWSEPEEQFFLIQKIVKDQKKEYYIRMTQEQP
jgi:hypothetical protein